MLNRRVFDTLILLFFNQQWIHYWLASILIRFKLRWTCSSRAQVDLLRWLVFLDVLNFILPIFNRREHWACSQLSDVLDDLNLRPSAVLTRSLTIQSVHNIRVVDRIDRALILLFHALIVIANLIIQFRDTYGSLKSHLQLLLNIWVASWLIIIGVQFSSYSPIIFRIYCKSWLFMQSENFIALILHRLVFIALYLSLYQWLLLLGFPHSIERQFLSCYSW